MPRQLTCDQTRDPVCDTDHVEHNNLCTLYQRGKSLSYRGPCQVCSLSTKPKGIKLVYDLSRQAEYSPTEKGVAACLMLGINVYLCEGVENWQTLALYNLVLGKE